MGDPYSTLFSSSPTSQVSAQATGLAVLKEATAVASPPPTFYMELGYHFILKMLQLHNWSTSM